MADDQWKDPRFGDSTFPPKSVSTDNVRDYWEWAEEYAGWRKIEASVVGGSALAGSAEAAANAAATVNPESLIQAFYAFRYARDVLDWLGKTVRNGATAIAGEGKAWQGAAADAFLDNMTLFADRIDAQVQRFDGVEGSMTGSGSVTDHLWNSAQMLKWAQESVIDLDWQYCNIARGMPGTFVDPNTGSVAVSATPQAKPMALAMAKVVDELAKHYQFTIHAAPEVDDKIGGGGPKPPEVPTPKPPGSGGPSGPKGPGPGGAGGGVPTPKAGSPDLNGGPKGSAGGTPNVPNPNPSPVPRGVGGVPHVPTPDLNPVPRGVGGVPHVPTPDLNPVPRGAGGVPRVPTPNLAAVPKPPPVPAAPIVPVPRPSGGGAASGPGAGPPKPSVGVPRGGSGVGAGGGAAAPPQVSTPPVKAGHTPEAPTVSKPGGVSDAPGRPGAAANGSGSGFPGSPGGGGSPSGAGGSGLPEAPDAGGLLTGDQDDWTPVSKGIGLPEVPPAGSAAGGSGLGNGFPGMPGGGGGSPPGAGGPGVPEAPDSNGLLDGDNSDWLPVAGEAGDPEAPSGVAPGGAGLGESIPASADADGDLVDRPGPAFEPTGPGLPSPPGPAGEEAIAVVAAATAAVAAATAASRPVEPAARGNSTASPPSPVRVTPPPPEPVPVPPPTQEGALGPRTVQPLVDGQRIGVVTDDAEEDDQLDRPEAAELLHDEGSWGARPEAEAAAGGDFVPVVEPAEDDTSGWDDDNADWLIEDEDKKDD